MLSLTRTHRTPTTTVLIGVIGGSGLYHLDHLTVLSTVSPLTPWGLPSSPITLAALPSGTRIAFLSRHGPGHTIPPSSVPSRANIAALKSLGVLTILSFSAVGSLRQDIPPGAFILPTQIIDRTKSLRPSSFFQNTSIVAHAMFGDPFTAPLLSWLHPRILAALSSEGKHRPLFTDKTLVCIEGPQFSTRAESLMYRQWGADLINMSAVPEAQLAREAEVGYALIAMATDYDSWRPQSAAVTAHDVFLTLHENGAGAKHVLAGVLDELHEALVRELEEKREGEIGGLLKEMGGMKFSIMPRSEKQDRADREKLAYVLPEYFGSDEGKDIASA